MPFHWLRYSCTTLTTEYSTRKQTFQILAEVLSKILELDPVRWGFRFVIAFGHGLVTSIRTGMPVRMSTHDARQ